jgi:putative transposase
MAMAAMVICYHPDGRRVRLLTDHTTGAYNTGKLITALQRLPALLAHAQVILIWDGLPAHRSTVMKTWLAGQSHWLQVIQLPGYAPDLNPVELVWGNLKATELANLCPDSLDDADTAAHNGLHRIGRSYQLCLNFLDHTGLRL